MDHILIRRSKTNLSFLRSLIGSEEVVGANHGESAIANQDLLVGADGLQS
ncbi:MAG: hypothetical protein WA902_18205 [Thermosynechococcaceae cyanobacterium]